MADKSELRVIPEFVKENIEGLVNHRPGLKGVAGLNDALEDMKKASAKNNVDAFNKALDKALNAAETIKPQDNQPGVKNSKQDILNVLEAIQKGKSDLSDIKINKKDHRQPGPDLKGLPGVKYPKAENEKSGKDEKKGKIPDNVEKNIDALIAHRSETFEKNTDLKNSLDAIKEAAKNGDFGAYKEALKDARSLARDLESGEQEEKKAKADILNVLKAIDERKSDLSKLKIYTKDDKYSKPTGQLPEVKAKESEKKQSSYNALTPEVLEAAKASAGAVQLAAREADRSQSVSANGPTISGPRFIS